jgi:short-subunit dehydrogenase
MMKQNGKQTVLVTGASSGIGMELAKVFAQQGNAIVLLARSTQQLEQLAMELQTKFNVRAEVIAADLSQANAPVQVLEELKQRSLTVDVLVISAGFGLIGAYGKLDIQKQIDMIQVNVTALAHLTRLLLPGMIQRNVGGVLNVASIAAYQAGPNMAVYYATKAFVLSFTEALHEEVCGTNLHVSCLCPGPTHTGFVAASNVESIRFFKFGAQSASEVANFGYAAYQKNQAIAIPGLRNKLFAAAAKLSPRMMSRKTAMALNQ